MIQHAIKYSVTAALVIASLPLFILLAWLLNRGMQFWPILGICVAVTSLTYVVAVWWLKPA